MYSDFISVHVNSNTKIGLKLSMKDNVITQQNPVDGHLESDSLSWIVILMFIPTYARLHECHYKPTEQILKKYDGIILFY